MEIEHFTLHVSKSCETFRSLLVGDQIDSREFLWSEGMMWHPKCGDTGDILSIEHGFHARQVLSSTPSQSPDVEELGSA